MKKIEKTKNKDEKLKPGQKGGMYLALSVCLVSIAVAALVTYMGFEDIGDKSITQSVGTNIAESVSNKELDDDDPLKDGERNSGNEEINESEVNKSDVPFVHEGDGENLKGKESLETAIDNVSEPEKEKEETVKVNTEPEINEEIPVSSYEVSESFVRPTEGFDIRNEYSSNLIYCESMKDYRTHNGIDIVTSDGENVLSSANGKVKDVYKDLLLGNIVEIEHGEYVFRYCGLDSDIKVIPGDTVSSGTIIGKIFEVPYEKNEVSHLHLEVKKDNLYVDPASLLK